VAGSRFNLRPEVTTDLALALVEAVRTEGDRVGLAFSVAVVDRAGEIVAGARMDGAPLGSWTLAVDKAYTAALWQMPSGGLQQSTQPGGDDWGFTSTTGGRIVVYPGGFPIVHDGELAGAVGVSGGTGEQDAAAATSALGALDLE
jgi:uncharacterized protein GlcG (DUF336 family)